MSDEIFSQRKIASIFGRQISKTNFFEAENKGLIPRGQRYKSGAINLRGWTIDSMPQIGEQWGFLRKPKQPIAISVFTTKGGVLKTSLTLNLARMSALHNIKTCIVGLDMQCDITSAFENFDDPDELENFEEEDNKDINKLIEKINQTKGLSDIFNKTARLSETICSTTIPTLDYIPETPELAAFNESLGHINKKEYWLKEKIVDQLKNSYDLIIMDCSPNWNRLITNALVASDFLISPLECKINNFRNFRVFRYFLKEFKDEMKLAFDTIFVPTRFANNKKLSLEIKNWYIENLTGCTQNGIRETVLGEEAVALKLSLPEHVPNKNSAQEMRELLREINEIELNSKLNIAAENNRFNFLEQDFLTNIGSYLNQTL